MTTTMITSPPEVRADGMKRWYVGDLEDNTQHVFLFESTREQRQLTNCSRFMVRVFNEAGDVLREQFFERTHTLTKFICRLFCVNILELGEVEHPVAMAA